MATFEFTDEGSILRFQPHSGGRGSVSTTRGTDFGRRYPDVAKEVVVRWEAALEEGPPLDWRVLRDIALHCIKELKPHILQRVKIDEEWVNEEIYAHTGRMPRKGVGELEENVLCKDWEALAMDFHMQVAYHTLEGNVNLPELIVTMDQVRISFEAGRLDNFGVWDDTSITGQVAVSMAGDVLPLHIIYKGEPLLVGPLSRFEEDVLMNDFHWIFSNSVTSWCTIVNFMEWVTGVLKKYYDEVCKAHPQECGNNPPLILILDCYPVHVAPVLVKWLREEHRWCKPLYMPPECTKQLQPLQHDILGWFDRKLRRQYLGNRSTQPGILSKKETALDALWGAWTALGRCRAVVVDAWMRAGYGEVLQASFQQEAKDADREHWENFDEGSYFSIPGELIAVEVQVGGYLPPGGQGLARNRSNDQPRSPQMQDRNNISRPGAPGRIRRTGCHVVGPVGSCAPAGNAEDSCRRNKRICMNDAPVLQRDCVEVINVD